MLIDCKLWRRTSACVHSFHWGFRIRIEISPINYLSELFSFCISSIDKSIVASDLEWTSVRVFSSDYGIIASVSETIQSFSLSVCFAALINNEMSQRKILKKTKSFSIHRMLLALNKWHICQRIHHTYFDFHNVRAYFRLSNFDEKIDSRAPFAMSAQVGWNTKLKMFNEDALKYHE